MGHRAERREHRAEGRGFRIRNLEFGIKGKKLKTHMKDRGQGTEGVEERIALSPISAKLFFRQRIEEGLLKKMNIEHLSK